jgi:hypothetical protein
MGPEQVVLCEIVGSETSYTAGLFTKLLGVMRPPAISSWHYYGPRNQHSTQKHFDMQRSTISDETDY